eukprot:CAMPEP_0179208274 /NCGR_PEP_ID=MMETSP0796-20121207/103867_1 /TAXON_ID=73915 /ORGANISM="Pyrodinium bahamense, Strain pbaha01" /LENGTH=1072 /DNA_ID=CAMNT_0020913223 /DNA_START=59 /DNA_END=3274 /DNA_ORIENTATION=+
MSMLPFMRVVLVTSVILQAAHFADAEQGISLQSCKHIATTGGAECGHRASAAALASDTLEDWSGSSHFVQVKAQQVVVVPEAKLWKSSQLNAETSSTGVAEDSSGTDRNADPSIDILPGKKHDEKGKTHSKYRLVGETVNSERSFQLLKKRGSLLGFSRDFWILLAICFGGMMVCYGVTVASVTLSVLMRAWEHCRGDILRDERGHIKRPVFKVGFLQRVVFRIDLNPPFAPKADMALRTAIACACCALPYYVPSLKFLNELGFSLSYTVVIIVFTVYLDLGNTLALAWYNFAGTLLPTVNCLLMFQLYPNGCSDAGAYSRAWWFGMINLLVFIMLQMCLNWNAGVRMFAVSWQVYFSMCFINPDDDTHFSKGFRNIILEGAAVSPLVGTVLGCVIAVLCFAFSPFGYSFSCLGSAQETALTLAWEEGRQWRRMISYFCAKERTVVIDKITGEADEMQHDVLKLEGLLGSNSWWECFDFGRPGMVRAHLINLDGTINQMHDWLRGALQAMITEDFNDQHDALLDLIEPKLTQLSEAASTLFYRAVRAGVNGGVQSSEKELLQQDLAAVVKAQKELASEFISARKKVYSHDALTPDSIGEHFFVFALSVYGQSASQYAESILNGEFTTAEGTGLFQAFIEGVADLFNFMPLTWIVRSSFSFFLAFALGWNGMPGILDPFNSTPAATTAFLAASEGRGGSAIMKNIARFQGTAGGTLLGQLVWSCFIFCNLWGQVFGVMGMVLLEFFSIYLYFASKNFDYVGALMGAYGAQHMMLDCDKGESASDIYGVILQQFLAIVSVTIADLLIGNVSSGTLAVQAYCKMTDVIGQSLKDFLCLTLDSDERKDIPDIQIHRKEILTHFAEMNLQGSEAPLEPRWYRTPWRADLWSLLSDRTFAIADKMAVIEHAASEGSRGGAARSAIVNSKSMREASGDFFHRAESVFLLAEKLLMHESKAPFDVPKAMMQTLLKQTAASLETRLPEIVKEVNEMLPESGKRPESVANLSQDDTCQVGATLLMMEGMMQSLNKIEDALFTSRELLTAAFSETDVGIPLKVLTDGQMPVSGDSSLWLGASR